MRVPKFKPTGEYCEVCGEPQYETPGGVCCRNGHGGAPSISREEADLKRTRKSFVGLPPIRHWDVGEDGERYPRYTDAEAQRIARASWGVHFLLPHPDDEPAYADGLREFHRAMTLNPKQDPKGKKR